MMKYILLILMAVAWGLGGCSRAPEVAAGPAKTAAPQVVRPLVAAGDYTRHLRLEGRDRSYLLHVPRQAAEATSPVPVVLVFHGAGTNAEFIRDLSGFTRKSDEQGFILVYPTGTGLGEKLLVFNVGPRQPVRVGAEAATQPGAPSDVGFVNAILDDLATILPTDAKRTYAAGFSNGGMFCQRLADALSGRIAAIATVGGTLTYRDPAPARPVPLLMIHGTEDPMVPYDGRHKDGFTLTPSFVTFLSVDETVRIWTRVNRTAGPPVETTLPKRRLDGTRETVRRAYAAGPGGADVVVYTVYGGGHTWPGQRFMLARMGAASYDLDANAVIWEFFAEHPMK